jgi:hypothetical protein
MKIAQWIIRWLSGDDGYPMSCDEWLAERVHAQRVRGHGVVRSARRHHSWR